jgi:IclR family transcriptional regulator, acetate operon repressor
VSGATALDGTQRELRRSSYQVLDRAIAVLELFDEQQPEWSASDVARTLDLPVPTVHRILVALADHELLNQDDATRRFRLGPAAFRLGDRARASLDLRALCLPMLRQLSQETGETALLTVLNDQSDRSVCVERVETVEPLRLSVAPGRELPLHAGASQKALAAFLDDIPRKRLLSSPLERLCDNTIIDADRLDAEFERIRSVGWASSSEETNRGAWGIAVPVIGRDGVICTVGIAGPIVRLSPERVTALVERVRDGAVQVAVALGADVPPVTVDATAFEPDPLTRRQQ